MARQCGDRMLGRAGVRRNRRMSCGMDRRAGTVHRLTWRMVQNRGRQRSAGPMQRRVVRHCGRSVEHAALLQHLHTKHPAPRDLIALRHRCTPCRRRRLRRMLRGRKSTIQLARQNPTDFAMETGDRELCRRQNLRFQAQWEPPWGRPCRGFGTGRASQASESACPTVDLGVLQFKEKMRFLESPGERSSNIASRPLPQILGARFNPNPAEHPGLQGRVGLQPQGNQIHLVLGHVLVR